MNKNDIIGELLRILIQATIEYVDSVEKELFDFEDSNDLLSDTITDMEEENEDLREQLNEVLHELEIRDMDMRNILDDDNE